MGPLLAFLSVVGECTGKTIDKLNFRRNHMGAGQLMLLIFSGMTISLFIYIILTRQSLPHFSKLNVALLLLVAHVSFVANAFDNRSLKVNDLSVREPLLNLKPMFAGFIVYVLFPSERKPLALIAFVLAGFIVTWGTQQWKLPKQFLAYMPFIALALC